MVGKREAMARYPHLVKIALLVSVLIGTSAAQEEEPVAAQDEEPDAIPPAPPPPPPLPPQMDLEEPEALALTPLRCISLLPSYPT